MSNIPQDLQDQFNALKSLHLTATLLNNGHFKRTEYASVEQSISFVSSLHKQVLEALVEHKDSDLIEEIKKYKESLHGSTRTETSSDKESDSKKEASEDGKISDAVNREQTDSGYTSEHV